MTAATTDVPSDLRLEDVSSPWVYLITDPTNRRRLIGGGVLMAVAIFALVASEARHAEVNTDLTGLRADLEALRTVAQDARAERSELKSLFVSHADRIEDRIDALDQRLQRIEGRLPVVHTEARR